MVIVRNKISKRIVEKLRLRKEKIISKAEIFHIMKEYQRIYRQKINVNSIWTYLRKSKYVRRVIGDYYYIYSLEERYNRYCCYSGEELLFLVLERMGVRWYVGLEGALREHKILWQALRAVPIINTRFSGIKNIGNSQFRFIRAQERKFTSGLIRRKTSNGVDYFYSDLEKTYLDFLYFHSYWGKDPMAVRRQLNFKVRKDVLRKYASYYSKKIKKVLLNGASGNN